MFHHSPRQPHLQGISQRHQCIDIRDDAVLLCERGDSIHLLMIFMLRAFCPVPLFNVLMFQYSALKKRITGMPQSERDPGFRAALTRRLFSFHREHQHYANHFQHHAEQKRSIKRTR